MRGVLGGVALVMALGLAPSAHAAGEAWAAVRLPSAQDELPQAMGSAAAGCLAGARPLPAGGEGYQVLRPQRNRFWAHPDTIAYVEGLGRRAALEGLGPLLVGDLSQPRGGPMPYGHGSHQHGLDVDIWFKLPGRPLNDAELAGPVPITMVKGTKVAATWGRGQMRLLQLAAADPGVDRIFVNPAIKAQACRSAGGDRGWLAKLRPWWGHDEHFHVRLACPAGSPGCVPQPAVPAGDGCGAELASWNAKPTLLPDSAKDKPNRRRPVLPAACERLLAEPELHAAGGR
ncbi:penicillin-insensitive murein endopeptidase [Magnetospirillum sp. UT-4]|uniref:penicillin-insensitive murein endopeptidase n=1 Tax=Magnetospirillum sp. UT-4 TaxID=2681467 RepID=UPI00138419EB|nr:penicillin-insensitive murein endopeptidase [Magnetospirillum sp. UT-4]CAA7616018.1 Penicillin-insensitive murein endopeptidase [Magnetospirillum sp. UT-4]